MRKNIPFPGNVWIGWSIYVPNDYTNGPLFQSKIFQLKMRDGPPRVEEFASGTFTQLVNIQIEESQLTMCLYRFTNTATGWKDECDKSRLMSLADLRGRWTDITLNYNSNGSGDLTLYVNGKAKARETNFVSFDVDKVFVAYGIYRPQVARTKGTVPTQTIYVDEMRIGTSEKAVAISEALPVD